MKNPLLSSRRLFGVYLTLPFVAVILFFPISSHGFVRDWINPEGGDFHDPGNWNPSSVPGDQQDAVFDLGQEQPYPVTFGIDAIIFDLLIQSDSVAMDLGGRELIIFDGIIAQGSNATGHLEVRNGTFIADRHLHIGPNAGSDGTFIFENGTLDIADFFRGSMNNTAYSRIELVNSTVDVGRFSSHRDGEVEIRGTTLETHAHDIRFADAGDATAQHVTKVLVTDGSHVIANRNYASSNNPMNLTELTISSPGTIFEVTGEIDDQGDWNSAWEGDATTVIEDGALLRVARNFRPGGAGVEQMTITNASLETPGTFLVGHRTVAGVGGTGILTMDNATVTTGVLGNIGQASFSTGIVTLKGGSTWTANVAGSDLGSSQGSLGSISIEEGSRLTVTEGGTFQIAAVDSATGDLVVKGEGSVLEGDVDIYVGGIRRVAQPIEGTGQFAVLADAPAELPVTGSEEVEYVGSGGFGGLEVASGGILEISGEVFVWETGSLSVNGGNIETSDLWFANAQRQVEIQNPVQQVPDGASELPVTDGLAIWFDADQLELNSGNPVAQWTDMSGNERHVSQETAGSQPTFVTDVIGGKPVIRFDGANDHLFTSAAFDPPIGQPNHVFVVFQANRPTGGDRVFDRGPAGSDRQTLRLTGGGGQMHAGSGIGGGFTDGGWNIHELLFNEGDSHWFARTLSSFPIGEGNVGTRTMEALQLGAHQNQTADFFDGDIAEFIVFDRALSDEEREAVENYLAAKYELPVWGTESTFVDAGPEFNVVLGAGANPYIIVGGDVNLGQVAALNVTLASGFEPASGQTFDLIGYGGSVSGNFGGLPEGTIVQAGGFAFEVSYTGGTVTLTETSAPAGTPFSEWVAAFDLPEGEDGPEGNPSGDGIPNAVKYALGMDPRVSSRHELPGPTFEPDGDNVYLTLEVSKNPEAMGVEYTVEVSGDLSGWLSGTGNVTILENTASTLKARDNTPVGEAGQRFIRVLIELSETP